LDSPGDRSEGKDGQELRLTADPELKSVRVRAVGLQGDPFGPCDTSREFHVTDCGGPKATRLDRVVKIPELRIASSRQRLSLIVNLQNKGDIRQFTV
jgi:hypothetical protein